MNTPTDTSASASPEELRTRMVDHIIANRPTTSLEVEKVMRAEPRHAYVADAPVEHAYDSEQSVITKRAEGGAALSCASAPSIVALMLDQLKVAPGHNVLEIGAGTGYNAGLLHRLTGRKGRVTTVDIDPEVTAQARTALDSMGHQDVFVYTRDGVLGADENAPYDRTVFTVGAWDLSEDLWRQLKVGGRMVIPLRWRGQTRTIGFLRTENALVADTVELCGFVPLVGQEGEHSAAIDPGATATLFFDEDQPIDPKALGGVLTQAPRIEAWSTVTVGPVDSFDGVWLRLTATEPGTCRIAAETKAVDTGLCQPAISMRSPALVDGGSVAYLALRRHEPTSGGERRFELGVYAHGPAGQQLAERFCEHIRAWNENRNAAPAITVYPAGSLVPGGGMVIDKPHTRLMLEI